MDLSTLQRERYDWVLRNFPTDSIVDSILGATEEIGELAHHYLKFTQGIRGDKDEHRQGMADAVADCVIFLAGVCDHLGLDYGELLTVTWARVKERDWVRYPVSGEPRG